MTPGMLADLALAVVVAALVSAAAELLARGLGRLLLKLPRRKES